MLLSAAKPLQSLYRSLANHFLRIGCNDVMVAMVFWGCILSITIELLEPNFNRSHAMTHSSFLENVGRLMECGLPKIRREVQMGSTCIV
jgi:hypothetical protein